MSWEGLNRCKGCDCIWDKEVTIFATRLSIIEYTKAL
jgi:hypothetical protein